MSVFRGFLPVAHVSYKAYSVVAGHHHATHSEAKVGFIGLGKMGTQMVSHLLDAGRKVVVHDTNSIAVDRAVKYGSAHPKFNEPAVEAKLSPSEVASTEGVDILFTMLPNVQSVTDVYLGANGILHVEGGPRPSLLVDCSTVDPQTARKIAAAADKVSIHPGCKPLPGLFSETVSFLDAPVSGGVLGAGSGTLSFMVGGQKAAMKAAEPLLRAMGSHVTYCGDHGTGQAARLCIALVMASSMAAVSESLALGRRLGLDPALLTRVLNSSSARCWSSEAYNPMPGIIPSVPSSQGYKPGLRTDMLLEQLQLAVMAGRHVNSPVPCSKAMADLYQKVHDEGMGDTDFTAIFRYVYGSGINDQEWEGGERLFNSQVP